ncbi:MAG: hemolysin family protein [Planctomycetota bacterium]|nr:hemolysin family protein [Planctomycetota bacterium]
MTTTGNLYLPPSRAIALAIRETDLPLEDWQTVGLAAAALALAGLFATVRSALLHCVPSRVLERVSDDGERGRMRPLLERADSLRTSTITVILQICFVLLVLGLVPGDRLTASKTGLALLISVPLLVFVCEVLPGTLPGSMQDALLVRFLPAFHVLQLPLVAPVYGLEITRRWTMKLLRIPEKPKATREIVEELRDVIEESDLEGDLAETQREIIENVFEFHDVDVAEVMTPRTEIAAVEVGDGLSDVVETIAESGHGRIPVYEGSLDTIIGSIASRDVIRILSNGGLDSTELRDVLRPAVFVPETKLVSELLQEFRRDKQKLAIVLDEYGGTAGLVTMGDILAEIVGDMHDEFDQSEEEEIRMLEDGTAEVTASLRVSEVNERLDLDLPEEEDYETLAGFVLARFGRFPKQGESFLHEEVEFRVLKANDRRVLKVQVYRPHAKKS